MATWTPISLVGDGVKVPCVDGVERSYLSFDAAASTAALPVVAERVTEFLPWYSGLCQVAGYKSQVTIAAYEEARAALLQFAGRPDTDTAIICRNTTEAIKRLASRLNLESGDVVLTTVAEHSANVLPWGRVARRRSIECDQGGLFSDCQAGAASNPAPAGHHGSLHWKPSSRRPMSEGFLSPWMRPNLPLTTPYHAVPTS